MTYSLEEILEYNDITAEQALHVLDNHFYLNYPPRPCDASPR